MLLTNVKKSIWLVSKVFDSLTYCPCLFGKMYYLYQNWYYGYWLIAYHLKTKKYKIKWMTEKALLTLWHVGQWGWGVLPIWVNDELPKDICRSLRTSDGRDDCQPWLYWWLAKSRFEHNYIMEEMSLTPS